MQGRRGTNIENPFDGVQASPFQPALVGDWAIIRRHSAFSFSFDQTLYIFILWLGEKTWVQVHILVLFFLPKASFIFLAQETGERIWSLWGVWVFHCSSLCIYRGKKQNLQLRMVFQDLNRWFRGLRLRKWREIEKTTLAWYGKGLLMCGGLGGAKFNGRDIERRFLAVTQYLQLHPRTCP